jgi:hypothetical protein
MFEQMEEAGLEIFCFFDGLLELDKLSTKLERRKTKSREAVSAYEEMKNNRDTSLERSNATLLARVTLIIVYSQVSFCRGP